MEEMTTATWIEAARHDHPESRYEISIGRYYELAEYYRITRDLLEVICAAYNYGFKRGRNYEKNKRRKKT